MLIEFTVANYRSLDEPQTFSLVRAKLGELVNSNTFTVKAPSPLELLRSAAIYGANASGKSNFLRALQTMKEIILDSATELKRGDPLPVEPFRLNQQARSKPSEFEATFIVEGVRYQYGFSATTERVHEEWLFAFPRGRSQRWFARAWDRKEAEYSWEFGSHFTGEKQLWQRSTRDNALFLSTAVQLNSQQLQPVYDWFSRTLRTGRASGWQPSFTASLCQKDDKLRVMKFLRAADLGIADVEVQVEPFDISVLPDGMSQALKDEIARDMDGKKILDIKTVHETADGKRVRFDLDDESDGTRRLFAFAGPWIDSLANGYVLFIDELHLHLHPELVRFLVQLFHNEKTNPHNAQLVFTTHETSILNQDVFRRDQIWFCEKNTSQSTQVFPLTDFSPRKGRENLEAAYLAGRYGAIPFVGSLPNIREV